MIWNEGRLPEDWTISKLLQSHSSRPNNPDIANAFFRSGYVESWGRGVFVILAVKIKIGNVFNLRKCLYICVNFRISLLWQHLH